MKTKRSLAITAIIIGVVLLIFSHYINAQVAEGQGRIEEGQSKVNSAKSIFGLTPVTKEVGKGFTSGAEARIAEGEQQVAYYSSLSGTLKIIGIILIIAGVIYLIVIELGKEIRKRR